MPWERTPRVGDSWMSRPLQRLTMLVIRFPVLTLLLAAFAVGASAWLTTTKLGFRTSRAELISPQSVYHHRWLEYTKEFGDKEDVVVVVDGENRKHILPAIDDLCREVSRRKDLFGMVMHDSDAPKLREKGLYQLPIESPNPKESDLRKIDALLDQAGPVLQGDWSQLSLGAMARQMSAAMGGGSAEQRQQVAEAMKTEMPRFAEGLQAALAPNGSYKSPWPEMQLPEALAAHATETRLISKDNKTGFIVLRFLEEDTKSFAQNDEPIRVLRQVAADVRARHPGVKIGLTGLPVIEHDEMQSSEKSMSVATFLSFAGVLAVMFIAFGGYRYSTMAMAALCIAMVWACGLVTLTVGYINVLSIAFASILFGMGIDYGIYYMARYLQVREETDSTSEALVRTSGFVGPGILAGAMTSTISFLAAALTDFPGVSQLGLIAGLGIALCWLGETTVLPAMIKITDRDGALRNYPAPLNLRYWLRPIYAWPRLTLAASAVMTATLAVGLCYLRYDYNLLNLQPEGLESVDLEHTLFTKMNHSAWFAVSVAKTPEEVLKQKAKFLALPSVECVEEIASALPSDCEKKRPIIERIHSRLANLPAVAPEIPVTPLAELLQMLSGAQTMLASMPDAAQAAAGLQPLGEMLQRIPPDEYRRRIGAYQQAMASDLLARLQSMKAASNPEPPALNDLPESVRSRFLGKSGLYAMQVYSKANIWEVGPMGQFVAEVRTVDPEATGNPLQVYEASREMKRSFEKAAFYALLAIVPVVLVDFRRLNHTLLAALPMGLGLLQTLGVMGLLDIPLSPANMIVLPLTLGLGMDTGINLIHEFRTQGRKYRGAGNAVLVAVVVNSLTTMVGFGALMIANHRGLQSLGRVLTIAMGFSILNSLLLPNLLIVGRFAHDGADSDDEEADDDLCDGLSEEEPMICRAA